MNSPINSFYHLCNALRVWMLSKRCEDSGLPSRCLHWFGRGCQEGNAANISPLKISREVRQDGVWRKSKGEHNQDKNKPIKKLVTYSPNEQILAHCYQQRFYDAHSSSVESRKDKSCTDWWNIHNSNSGWGVPGLELLRAHTFIACLKGWRGVMVKVM